MNSDTDEDDPWGEEPRWAIQNHSKVDKNHANSKGLSSSKWDDDNDESLFAAQHLLILIDCHPSMFVPSVYVQHDDDEDEDNDEYIKKEKDTLISPFDAALMSCEKLLRLRVHYVATSKANGKRDGVGVLFFGITKKKSSPSNTKIGMSDNEKDDDESYSLDLSPSLHEFIPIAPPGTQQILQVRNSLPKGFDDNGEDSQESRNSNNNYNQSCTRVRNLKQDFVDEDGDSTFNETEVTVSSLRSALHEAIKLFMNAKCVKKNLATSNRPLDAKTIWIFTNQDDPCQGDEREKQQSIVIAKDAIENGIEIQLWPLKDSHSFNTKIFYRHITSHSQAFGNSSKTSNQQKKPETQHKTSTVDTLHSFQLGDVLNAVQKNWKKTRKIQSIPLLLPDWQENPDCPGIMLDIYQLIKYKRKPVPIVVHQETNKATLRMTQTLAVSTGEIIENKDRLVSFVEFGGKRVYISKEEVATIKKRSNSNPNFASLILCGFKSCSGYSSSVTWQHTLEKSLFGYPNEDMISGSSKAFEALHSSMIRKRVYGIGELLLRVTGSSRIVAIIPQEGKLHSDDGMYNNYDSFGTKISSPAGLILIPLPFEDDLRAVPENCGPFADGITIDAAVDLIRHQQLNGIEVGYSFDNPALRKFWHYIECIALGTKLKNKLEDETQMDTERILYSAKAQIDTLKALLPDDDNVKSPPVKKRKR